MKRLYIGGLGHTISQKDIKDRFGKFGEVSDVEIIARKDEHGAPLKTFGYVNINITDAEYKRCMNILNKSTWKGGTLLIQPAKESFLHRLAEERQQIAEKTKTPEINPQEKLVDSLKAAGVENFHMKAAVPGTEIPGHKDWTVSKFGRVLPVLNLKCKGKNKIFKYDPSKHCHNIKRLDATDDFTPVSKLTWEVSGGDDEISKKRRGEFPQYKPSPKRSQGETSLSLRNFTPSNGIKTPSAIEQKNAMVIQENGLPPKGKQKPAVKNSVRVFDSDADSEDEIRMLVDQERLRNPKQMFTGGDDDNLEVVGDDFVVKSNVVWGGAEQDSLLTSSREDEEYDSADTDEILNQSKSLSETGKPQNLEPAPVSQDSPAKSSKNKDKTNSVPVSSSSESDSGSHDDSDDDSEDLDDDDSEDSDYEAMMSNCYRLDLSLADLEQLAKNVEVSSDDEKTDVAKKEAQKTQQPSVSNKKHGNNPEDILASLLGDNTPEKDRKKKQVSTVSLPAFIGTKDLFGDPNPASSELNLKRAGPSIDCESTVGPKRLKQNSKLSEQGVSVDKSQQVQPFPSVNKIEESDTSSKNDSSSEESDSSEEEDGEDEEDCSKVLTSKTVSTSQSVRTDSVPKTDQTLSTPLPTSDHSVSSTDEDSSSDDEDDTEEKIVESKDSNTQIKQVPKTKPSASHSSSDSSSEESETSDEDDQKSSRTQLKDSKKVESHSMVLHSTVPDAQKQQQDNQKRLAALEQRQKETEQQKKLIQGALANVDTPSTNRGKHIVFDSDDELEGDETTSKQEEQTTSQKKGRFEDDSESDEDQQRVIKEVSKGNENKKTGGSKLFDSSDDEDDGDEDDRFQIKPQFEGKAGQKLMKLQARFGTDSRFQMDSRFLDSDNETEDQDENPPEKDGEQDLVDEKNKNLDILQSVLNTSIPSKDPRKESVKSKTFKDVSALHYDPTREEHAAFETKKEESKKESKAARRKKREEAEKLPEVSKEIYFDVAADLKEVFVAPKEKPDENETVSWDKKTETTENKTAEEDTAMDLSFMTNEKTNTEASEGFKFSFFEEGPVAEKSTKTDEYKIETLKGSKLSWQVDPRFQDSSSEEEEVDEAEENQTASCMTTEEPTQTKKSFFFFFLGDERLKEGPAMFCRSTKLEEQREAWEETRASLREECRKKHKDAKRHQRTLKT